MHGTNMKLGLLCCDETVVEMRTLYIKHRQLKGDTQKEISHAV
jgi:hypothetical protein